MEKNFAYIHLMEEMKNRRCPICALINKSTERSIQTILYECIMDPKLHEKIVRMRGFCIHHSRQFMAAGDPLAHAIVYSDILRAAKKEIANREFSEYTDHTECLFCKEEKDNERFYVAGFADAYTDSEFRKKYVDEGLLCIHHLGQLLDENPAIYQAIENDTLPKYDRLIENLDEIRRKSDYRFQDEAWTPEEKTAWKIASATVGSEVDIRGAKRAPDTGKKEKLFARLRGRRVPLQSGEKDEP